MWKSTCSLASFERVLRDIQKILLLSYQGR